MLLFILGNMGAVGSNAANGNVSSGSMILGGPQGASGVNLRGGMGMIFCYQNCSSDRENFWNLRLKVENLQKSLEQFILTVKGQKNFW